MDRSDHAMGCNPEQDVQTSRNRRARSRHQPCGRREATGQSSAARGRRCCSESGASGMSWILTGSPALIFSSVADPCGMSIVTRSLPRCPRPRPRPVTDLAWTVSPANASTPVAILPRGRGHDRDTNLLSDPEGRQGILSSAMIATSPPGVRNDERLGLRIGSRDAGR